MMSRDEATALRQGLRSRMGFCDLECDIGPSPQCDTAGRRHKPCVLKGYIAEDTERLRREFGIEVDRIALVNEVKEREKTRLMKSRKQLKRAMKGDVLFMKAKSFEKEEEAEG